MGTTAAAKRKKNATPGLYRRGNVWHVDRVVGDTHIRRSLRTSDKATAERQYAKLVRDVHNAETLGEIPVRSFEQAAARYMTYNATRKKSFETDKSRFRVLFRVDPALTSTPLSKINNGTLARFVERRQNEGASAQTINRALALVSSVLNQATNKWTPRWLHVAERIDLLPVEKRVVRRPITWEEQGRLLDALPDHLVDMAVFAVHTGFRDRELYSLRWNWLVDYPVINAPVVVLPGDITKSGQPRLVPLNRPLRTLLARRRRAEDAHETHVFHYRGEPISRMYNSAWMTARARADLDGLRVHDLRHTAAQRMLDAGVEGTIRDAILGHADAGMRARYAPPPVDRLIDAVERIADKPAEHETRRVPTVEEVIDSQHRR